MSRKYNFGPGNQFGRKYESEFAAALVSRVRTQCRQRAHRALIALHDTEFRRVYNVDKDHNKALISIVRANRSDFDYLYRSELSKVGLTYHPEFKNALDTTQPFSD